MAGSGRVRGWRCGRLIAVALGLCLAPLCLSAAPATPAEPPGDDVVPVVGDLGGPSETPFDTIPTMGSSSSWRLDTGPRAGLGDAYDFKFKLPPKKVLKPETLNLSNLNEKLLTYQALSQQAFRDMFMQGVAFGYALGLIDDCYSYDKYGECDDCDDYDDCDDCDDDDDCDDWDDNDDYNFNNIHIDGYAIIKKEDRISDLDLTFDRSGTLPNNLFPSRIRETYDFKFRDYTYRPLASEYSIYSTAPGYGQFPPPLSAAPVHANTPIAGACPRAAAVLSELNSARTDPAGYLAHWPGANGDVTSFLHRQMPLPPLTYSPLLEQAAIGFAAEQSAGGPIGHIGINGSTPRDRIQATGVFTTKAAEVISYGYPTPSGEIQQLITDAGNPGTPHRDDIYSPLLQFAGVGCGPQPKYGTVTVIDMTASIMLAPRVSPPPPPP